MDNQHRAAGRPARTSLDTLVDAAIEIGLQRFTLGKVAKHVGVAEATVYNYVSGRDDLYRKACDRTFASVSWDTDATTWTGYVDEISERAVALVGEHPGLTTYLFYGPFEPDSIRIYTTVVDTVMELRPGTSPNEAYLLASRPLMASLHFAAIPGLSGSTRWVRQAMMQGMEEKLGDGDLPDLDPNLDGDWRRVLRTPGD
ncbi:MAG: TetR/AcrR family transcriptional regulator [Corynebacterium sp.]|uniref:TetR/AcrR family transcriptional regulator n=1 Tax=Corynebacterium TaxID=1716 RepID=UPI003F9A6839